MTDSFGRPEFKAALKRLRMTQRAFAGAVGLAEVTVNQWGTYTPIPAWVPLLLQAWADVQWLRDEVAAALREGERSGQ